MWKRRLVAALAALLVAAAGGVMLTHYVEGADQRAMAGMQTAKVLVAVAPIPEGTAGDALAELVTTETLPVKAITAGSLSSLDGLQGLVASVDLQPGEQLLAARFVDPESLEDQGGIDIPKGMQQVSVSMERPRMLGNLLTPGATVGVFVSFAKEGEQPAQTHALLHKVLVTRVGDKSAAVPPGDSGASTPPEAEAEAAADSVPVTFALTASDAEKLLFGAEHGRLWLSLEPLDASTSDTRVVTLEDVYE